ncbi:L-threonylcarbamoyladenylate synthase [Thioalkalivibrio sp. XN279]|uniref:L-threonylcarbamoyladenylate synthase n=1 Tax=Thioalkalivibrio sp. XN279 TaxID=2714953 RepID=UPI00140A5807|nr:Sua5/YciO/YrdC/YwlC family protein [Thioalkalivibrio sp. XN279]NHA15727.1 tRNA threonylcarbamoyladenosine biosynthesis protein RimN [Thioalkalivibrio sp. XN279]
MAGTLAIRRAAALVRAGGVIAYPTESVWGLGCDPLDAEAVARILAIKERPATMGLILIAAEMAQLDPWIEPVCHEVEARVAATWPGSVTWVFPAQPWVPFWVHGGRGSLAVRVTAHAQSAALCRAVGYPVVSTSANRSGHPPARTAAQVRRWLGDDIDFILGGATGNHPWPSDIRDALTGRALRPA